MEHRLKNSDILISGASIAGPALAYGLRRYGFNPTVVERAPALRGGGFGVDFRGETHLSVLKRMGILEEVRRLQTNMGERIVVDESGKRLVALPASFMSGEVEIARGDLSRIMYERTRDTTKYIFGDSIVSMTETTDGVDVTFERVAPRTFDLVVAAGPESQFISFLGHYIAGFDVPNYLNLDHTGLIYNVPGREADIGSARDSTRAIAGFVFASEPLEYDRHDPEQQKKILADIYADAGWEVPRMIEAMWEAQDFYFDSISRIDMDHWSKGRVVLLGDAGYGATVGGMGTGTAMVGAYVLAGELAAAGGDHRTAFARYEAEIRDYAKGCQKLANNAGPFLAPPTRWKIWHRNQMYRILSSRALSGVFNKMTTRAASAITLKDYRG